MTSSFAKIIAAGFALSAPFVTGLLVRDLPVSAALLLGGVGLGIGFAGLAIFCSLDTREVVAHLRRLNPNLRGEG